MRTLLINPFQGKNVYSDYSSVSPVLPPLGLLYLASVFKNKKSNVSLIDCNANKISYPDLIKKISEINPDIVCLTASTSTIINAKKIADIVKKINKKTLVILGGSHISLLPKKTLEEIQSIDIGCIGESEKTLEDLIDYFNGHNSLNQIRGIVYRDENKIIKNEKRPLVENLDILPIPAFDLIKDLNKYSHSPFRAKKNFFHLVTSRGCSYNCTYCDQGVFSNKWRAHSAERVIEMILILKKLFNIDYISFEDDDFAIDNKRVLDICDLIIENKIKINWGCSLNLKDIKDEQILIRMRESGCKIIYTGIESGSEDVLRKIRKISSKKEIEKKICLIRKNKINVYGSFILGLPFETKKNIEETLKFSRKLKLNGISFHIYTPYPNTFLYNELVKKKKIPKKWNRYSGHNCKPIITNKHFSQKYLLKKQKQGYFRFYLRPNYIYENFYNILDISFLKKAFKFISGLIIQDEH